jgi:hypothetical protein
MTGDESQLTRQHAAALRAVAAHYRNKGLAKAGLKPERKSLTERIPMAEGIDLVIDKAAYGMPSPKELVDIALLIRKTFDPWKKQNEDDD